MIIPNGAGIDTRPLDKKLKDYSALEVASTPVAPFKNKRPEKLTATVYNQWYVGSCVPHALLTQLEYEGILSKEGASQLRLYRKRVNYDGTGCIGTDIYDKIKTGLNPQSEFPTPAFFTEQAANEMGYVQGELGLIEDFSYFQYKDADGRMALDKVPQDIAGGKPVAIFVYATKEEWEKEYVEIIDPTLNITNAYVRHAVCLVPHGDFEKDGKRWLTVHDSAPFGGRHLRYIEADKFFIDRTFFAAKTYKKEEESNEVEEPRMLPTVACSFGEKSGAVVNLQTYLVNEGKLGKQYITGYYGVLTSKAVLWWQLEHWKDFTDTIPTLLEYKGYWWGKQSIAAILKT
jgi:hypothetical protein